MKCCMVNLESDCCPRCKKLIIDISEYENGLE